MRMYICAFPRMLFAALLLGLPLSAQTARIRNNGAQANLHIEVKVVPAIAVHHRDKDNRDKGKNKDGDREDNAVSYNLNPRHEEFSVIEVTRPMLVDSGNNTMEEEQVRIVTVVPR